MVDADVATKILGIFSFDTKPKIVFATIINIMILSGLFYLSFVQPILSKAMEIWKIEVPQRGTEDIIIYVIITFLFGIINVVIFSADKLYKSGSEKNKYVEAFRRSWPSKHIREKFGLKYDEAKYYWFEKFFNRWRNPEADRHTQYTRTLEYGYRCRFVYWVIVTTRNFIIISFMLLLGFAFISLKGWIGFNIGYLFFPMLFFIGVCVIFVIMKACNRVGPRLTGVWERYAEINEMHIKWLDENVPDFASLKRGI